MTNGQLLIGQTGADPSPQTLGTDATLAANGALTIANNAVSIWAGLRLLQAYDGVTGYGRLLRDHLAA